MPSKIACPSCGAHAMTSFYEVNNVPVHSCIMLPSRQEAIDFPRGHIELGFCEECAFVSNVAFDSTVQDYNPGYEDQQSFSPTFNSFAGRLAQKLVDKYDMRDKTVVEVGCGKGDFLILMCEIGNNSGVGIDPTCVKERMKTPAIDRITVVQDYYSERYAHHAGDMVLCRHTLEHIHNTYDFVKIVRDAIGDRLDTVVFFEIPDVVIVLKDKVFWDVYYEHCTYFSPGSLGRLFRRCGFEPLDIYREYDDQYLLIDAKPVASPSNVIHPLEEDVEEMRKDVEAFANSVPGELEKWKRRIAELNAKDQRPAIWGSGSKCVSFLTTLGLGDEIGCVVDINPHRHGKFIPGAGREVKSPEYLKEFDPGTIIVMNPIYRDEISEMVARMGVDAEVTTV